MFAAGKASEEQRNGFGYAEPIFFVLINYPVPECNCFELLLNYYQDNLNRAGCNLFYILTNDDATDCPARRAFLFPSTEMGSGVFTPIY